ncbi:MAG: hypothetical protein ABI697_04510 [Devosia sp.]
MPHPLSPTQHTQLIALGDRLVAVVDQFEILPHRGPAPAALRGEVRRVLNALVRLLPENIAIAGAASSLTRRAQMVDVFVATMRAVALFKPLLHQPKYGPNETYPRSLAGE